MPMRKICTYILPLSFIFLFSCGGGGCGRYGPGSAIPVTVEPVQSRESSPIVIVPGVLTYRDRVEIKLPHTAKISEVLVNKGDGVLIGAVLAKLSDEEINLQLAQLRSSRKEAETLLEKNSYLLKNRDRLLEEGKIDKTQYDGLEIEASSNESTLNRVKADIAVAEYNAAHLQITSPISGIIIEKYATPLQAIAEDQILFVIVNINPILVSFPLTADESAGIRTGMPLIVRVEDLDDAKYDAVVSYIGTEISQPGKTFDVWASISNPDYTLKSGMIATAEFSSAITHKVFTVPYSAVITRDRDKYVFTVNAGAAHQTKVHIRNIHDGIAEISSGLAENDLVVIKGVQGLQDGNTVEMWRR